MAVDPAEAAADAAERAALSGRASPIASAFRRPGRSPVMGVVEDDDRKSPICGVRDVDHAGPLPLPIPVRLVGGRRSPIDRQAEPSESAVYDEVELTILDKRRLGRLSLQSTKCTVDLRQFLKIEHSDNMCSQLQSTGTHCKAVQVARFGWLGWTHGRVWLEAGSWFVEHPVWPRDGALPSI
jgi:hypothetical protein